MTSRERMLIALENGKPDRLPCQVHNWMPFYLKNYLGGCNAFEAYERFGMDWAIYCDPIYVISDKSRENWQVKRIDLGINESGDHEWRDEITTPDGTLTVTGAWNEITSWETTPLIKGKNDFELFIKYHPVPEKLDFTPLYAIREKVGDNGIMRSCLWGYGQSGPWQSFCYLVGTEQAIYYAVDDPDWVHYCMQKLVDRQLKVIEMMEGMPMDLIENGGGAGSNTVISPAMHAEFCVPYDRQLHDALHAVGLKVVYHLCGGLMKMLDNVVANGADGLETMTPPGMGGDCNLAECTRRVGDKLFFVGGFDQKEGFENGNPEKIRRMVRELHEACPDGGYICSPSDHFFHGDPANIQAFVDACKECTY